MDGICIEFYQKFWPILGNLLVDVFNQCFHDGKLTASQRTAVLSLIHKKDDKDNIINYRPISLTNVDYRILAFVLANRLQKVIGKIISDDQTAYIKGRYMWLVLSCLVYCFNNIRLVSDVIDNLLLIKFTVHILCQFRCLSVHLSQFPLISLLSTRHCAG